MAVCEVVDEVGHINAFVFESVSESVIGGWYWKVDSRETCLQGSIMSDFG